MCSKLSCDQDAEMRSRSLPRQQRFHSRETLLTHIHLLLRRTDDTTSPDRQLEDVSSA
jgi:hypothetical protein